MSPYNPRTPSQVTTFRRILAGYLANLRKQSGLRPEEVAAALAVLPGTLRGLEDGTRQPTMHQMIRACHLYRADPFRILEAAAQHAREESGPCATWREVALLLFAGVTPEHMWDTAPQRRVTLGKGSLERRLAEGESLGDLIRLTRPVDPLRREIGRKMLGYYEDGLSIRQIKIKHAPDISFGMIRSLLLDAGAEFRRR